jgi:hypothetical protein
VSFFSDDDEGCVCLIVAAMTVYSSTTVCILLVFCCLYMYQLCIVMFMNTSNVCLRTYIIKKRADYQPTCNWILFAKTIRFAYLNTKSKFNA